MKFRQGPSAILLLASLTSLLASSPALGVSIPGRWGGYVSDSWQNTQYFPGVGVRPLAALGEGQAWHYLGGAGCYTNVYGRTVAVSGHMSQAGGGRDMYIAINGVIVSRHSGYTYNDRLDVSAIVPPGAGFCIGASAPAEMYILR